jgi:hypothetical protein
MPLRTEEAYDFLVAHLATIPANVGRHALVGTRDAHIYVPDLATRFWQRLAAIPFGDLTDEHFRPFYDAAWELARIGVIRPGRVAPKGQQMATNDFGEHWSITEFGFQWLADASKRSYLDMSRLSEIFASFTSRFGPGFAQRAVEAVRTYRTGNYLSACAMVGAAAESVLLAVAIAKKSNEAEVLKMYQNSGGRSRVTAYVTGKSTPSVAPEMKNVQGGLKLSGDATPHTASTRPFPK